MNLEIIFYIYQVFSYLSWIFYFNELLPVCYGKKKDFIILYILFLMPLLLFVTKVFAMPGSTNDNATIRFLVTSVLYFLIVCIVKRASIKRLAFVYLLWLILVFISEAISMVISSLLYKDVTGSIITLPFYVITFVIESFVLISAVVLMKRHEKELVFTYKIILIFSVVQFIATYYISYFIVLKKEPTIVFLFILVLLMILSYVTIITLIKRFISVENGKTKNVLEQEMNRNLLSQMEYLDVNQKVMQEISSLMQYENVEELISLKDRISSVKSKIYCDDSSVNALLGYFIDTCKEKNIPFDIDIQGNIKGRMNSFDLNTILNNILKNAVEADPTWIKLDIKTRNDMLLIECKNSINENKQRHEQKLISGHGKKILEKIIHDYHGSMNVEQDKKQYTVTILISKCTNR